MSNETLLVLGASRYQLPTIEYAQSIGLRVCVTDNVPDNPGHAVANASFSIDTTDAEAILKLAKEENVNGIIAPCTDVAVTTAAYVNLKLGVSSISPLVAQTLTSKIKFREFQRENNLSYPEFQRLDDQLDIIEKIDFSRRWIIKPERSSGSKGIFIIDSLDQLKARYPESRDVSLNRVVSLEEFVEGYQGTLEGSISDGKIDQLFYLDRQTAASPYVCTLGHRTPSVLSDNVKNRVREAVQQLLNLLDIDTAVFDLDYIWDGDQVFVLEVSPRLGGNSITQLLLLSYGVNFLELAVNVAMGKSINTSSSIGACVKEDQSAVILLGVEQDGELTINRGVLAILNGYSWVVSVDLHSQEGTQVQQFVNGRHCLATVFITAGSYDELIDRELAVRNMPMLDVKK